MIHDVDQLAEQLRQDGYVVFQLLTPVETARLNGLVRGIAYRCGKQGVVSTVLAAYCLRDNIHCKPLQVSSCVDVGLGPAFSTESLSSSQQEVQQLHSLYVILTCWRS